MPILSEASEAKLVQCVPSIQAVARRLINYMDFTVVCGHRGEAEQNAATAAGNSKTPWPTSKHNSLPSKAIDIVPYISELPPHLRRLVGTTDQVSALADAYQMSVARASEILYLHYAVLWGGWYTIACQMGFNHRWGGNWDRDQNLYDNHRKLQDLPHIEEV